jgi:ferrous iron transport protein A
MNYLENTTKLSLNDVKSGCYAEIKDITGGVGLREKILSLGLLPGKTVQVISNRKQGPVIIKIDGTRLILGRGTAEKIHVTMTHCDLNFNESPDEA